VVGAIELIGGISVIVMFSMALRNLGDWTTIPASVGGLFAFIGIIVLIYGLSGKDTRDNRLHRKGYCLYCGRRVEAGVMICPRCGGKPSDGKSP